MSSNLRTCARQKEECTYLESGQKPNSTSQPTFQIPSKTVKYLETFCPKIRMIFLLRVSLNEAHGLAHSLPSLAFRAKKCALYFRERAGGGS